MKRIYTLIVLLVIAQTLIADIPSGYYDSATGTGYTLKTQLYDIIKDHNALSYTGLWTAMQATDKKANGYVWDMYSDIPDGTPDYDYTFVTNQCGNYTGEGSCYNREHSFPKSWFDDGTPMYTDLFHLVPTDGYVNGKRSNYPFGEVGSASWTSTNGSKLGTSNYPGYTGTVFEPIDEYKGDFARGYFYMATRYEDVISSWSGSDMLNGSNDQCFTDWALAMLIEWHYNDPVSQKELNRNDSIQSFQNNRNPFIDHPEYVAQIWGGGGNIIPSISNITINPEYPTSSDNINILATITDSDGTVESAELHWGISSGSLNNTIALTNSSGDTYSTITSIPSQSDGTVIYFEIEATDDEPEINTSSEQSYEVCDNPTFNIFYEDFETVTANQTVNINGWSQYYEAGTETWEGKEYNSNKYAQISAYQSGESSNITWLMTPEIDLSIISEANLTFLSKDAYNYGDPVELFITTNYSGNPATTTWTKLNAIFATGSTSGYADNFTESGSIDLTSYCGNVIYLGYKYKGGDPSLTATMQIDDVLITGKNIVNNLPTISNIATNPEIPTSTEHVTIYTTIVDSDGTISTANVLWGTSTGLYPNTVTMSNSGDNFTGEIPMQANGTTVFFKIDATDNEAGNKQSSEQSYTVNNLPVISNVLVNPENPTATENVTISATIIDPDGSISSVELKWGITSGSYTNTIPMTNSGDDYSGDIPMQAYGTKVYFIIDASDNKAENKQTSEYEYTVNDLPAISNIDFTPTTPISTENVTVSATITDSDGTISSADLKWGTTPGAYTNTISMTNSDDDYSGVIPMQTNGTEVYFIIAVLDNETGNKQTSEYNYTVNNLPVISNIETNPENPTATENVTISATITDTDGSISSADLKWGTTSGSYTNTISMTNSGDDYSGEIPAQIASAKVYFKIEAIDNLFEKANYNSNYSVSESTSIMGFSNRDLKIYPNPVNDILFIKISNSEVIGTIKLYNAVGEKVYETTESYSSEASINLNSFTKGIYFIQVENEQESFLNKIIIK